TVECPRAAHAIAEAREKGVLKENAEYDAATESQGILEAKIAKLESDLAQARILDPNSVDTSKVSILTTVQITNLKTRNQSTSKSESEKEAHLKLGKISVTCPIGKGLLGKTVGEVTEVQVPAGVIELRIDEITI